MRVRCSFVAVPASEGPLVFGLFGTPVAFLVQPVGTGIASWVQLNRHWWFWCLRYVRGCDLVCCHSRELFCFLQKKPRNFPGSYVKEKDSS